MTKVENQLIKDIQNLRKVKSFFDDGSVAVRFSRNNVKNLTTYFLPKNGYFRNCFVKFEVNFTNYPSQKPVVTCKSKIFHPNISSSGSICFSMFGAHWEKRFNVEQYLNGLLFHLNHPNHSSPLNGSCVEKNSDIYDELVQRAASGEKIKGTQYDVVLIDPSISNIKNSVDFSSKVDFIELFLNRFKCVASLTAKIRTSKDLKTRYCSPNSAIHKFEKLYSETSENTMELYNTIYSILDESFKKIKKEIEQLKIGKSNETNKFKNIAETEKEVISLLFKLDEIYKYESKCLSTLDELIKFFGSLSTQIFLKFTPFIKKLRSIIYEKLESVINSNNNNNNNNIEKTDNSNLLFDQLISKIGCVRKTNSLELKYFSNLENSQKFSKLDYQKFLERFELIRKLSNNELVLIELNTNSSNRRVSKRIMNQEICKTSKYFFKELVVMINDNDKDGNSRIPGIVVSNGREFIDFETISYNLRKEVKFSKISGLSNSSNPIKNLNSIPFFYNFMDSESNQSLPVIINENIFKSFGDDEMVYFASGAENFLIGLDVKYIKKMLKFEEFKFIKVVDFVTFHSIEDRDDRKYRSKNIDYYFNEKKHVTESS